MSSHPERCSMLRVHRERKPFLSEYISLKGYTLAWKDATKLYYLGVELTSDMSWNLHASWNETSGSAMGAWRVLHMSPWSDRALNTTWQSGAHTQMTTYISWKLYSEELLGSSPTSTITPGVSLSRTLEHLQLWESLQSRQTKVQLTMLYKNCN